MMGKTHAVLGANTVWVTAVLVSGFSWHPLLPVIGALGGLLPDLDANESMAKHLSVSVGSRKDRVAIKPLALPSMILSTVFGHRGMLHSIVGTALFAVLGFLLFRFLKQDIQFLTLEFPIVLTLGYVSHLVGDSMTRHGVKYFWPWQKRFHLLPKFLTWKVGSPTGAMIESILFVLFSLTLVLWLIRSASVLT